MTHRYVMAFDAGTTSIRAILFDKAGDIAAVASQEFPQIYPRPGWVEHNPLDIWNTQVTVAKQVLAQTECGAEDIAAIGVTNQRETVVVWDRATGEPVHNAIVWQDRRTAALCEELKARGLEEYVKRTTGLIIDAYFSGTKVKWILDNVSGARERAERGELAFGTVDSWLIWNLTGGAAHVTDYTNASRTMLFDITRLDWDQRLLDELDIPRAILPEVRPTSEVYGHSEESVLLGACIPVAAAVGDQQGALFGQACFEVGTVKATYGTEASLVLNTGDSPVFSDTGMLTTHLHLRQDRQHHRPPWHPGHPDPDLEPRRQTCHHHGTRGRQQTRHRHRLPLRCRRRTPHPPRHRSTPHRQGRHQDPVRHPLLHGQWPDHRRPHRQHGDYQHQTVLPGRRPPRHLQHRPGRHHIRHHQALHHPLRRPTRPKTTSLARRQILPR
ncbi:FGGY family carbohydrate kinase [Streptomyces hygroscopicus]|uniref:FGGY family carbohydrate kinase n=1 Tax=Streptomyces hygroscopicus TaxID=1912 RepID=UPI003F4CCB19